MLYECWRTIARDRANETALWDMTSGRVWRFRELLQAGDTGDSPSPVAHPRGNEVGFILALLRAWRSGVPACPLEADQSEPGVQPPPPPCCHLKITSATTGQPRMIALTAEQLLADAQNIVSTMGLRPEWPNLGAISLAHSYGFSNLVLPLLLHGIPLVLAQSPLPEMVKTAAAGHAGLTIPGVPALWRAWLEGNAIPGAVRLAISAGAPLTVDLEGAVFQACALKIHNFYGSSECGGIAYDRSDGPREDEACVGSALDNVRLTMNDEGCLQVRSRAVAQGYWPDDDPALSEGRFQTSDLAELKGGLLYLRGRQGDLLNVAGRKVSPGSIEAVLRTHPAVRECLVFGVPAAHRERKDSVVAAVVLRHPATPRELREFILRQLPAWQVPRDWLFVSSLQPNARGKVSRAEWARHYAERLRPHPRLT